MRRTTLAHLLLLAVVFVWGVTFVLVKDALAGVSPLLFNLLRMTLATLALGLVYRRDLRHIHAAPRLPYRQLAVVQIGVAALTIACLLPFFEPHPFL
ncbi:MAG TPA: EamA family transporter, partial [Acidobacteriaceae bacterium]